MLPLPRLLLWYSAAALFYLIAVWLVLHGPGRLRLGRKSLWFLFAAAVIFRLTLLPLAPASGSQLWRFHWDGQIEHAGFNPYVWAPNNPLFNPIRTPADAAIPSPGRAAIHPPLAQLLAHQNYNWFPGLRSEKILLVVFDLLLLALLGRMLAARRLPPEWALIYGWSPLAVLEVAGHGHIEPIAALLVLLALAACERRARSAGVAIAAAAATLWYALALVPVVAVAAGNRWARLLRWLFATAVVLSLPFWVASSRFVLGDIGRNLRAAAAAPSFNASLYALAQAWFGSHAGAVLACALGALVIVLACVRCMPPLRAAFWILGVLLLVLPQVQPWFLLWLLPLLVFFPEPAWLYFSVAVVWAYLIGRSPPWTALEYAPLYLLLAWQAWCSRSKTAAAATLAQPELRL